MQGAAQRGCAFPILGSFQMQLHEVLSKLTPL